MKQEETSTTADVVFLYEGKAYPIIFDFMCKTSYKSVIYQFEEGSYASQLNRCQFIIDDYPEFEEDYDDEFDIILSSISNVKNAISDDEEIQLSLEPIILHE